MEFNDYYRQELSTLRIEGAEFSKKNPGLSSFLSKEGQDPDVERLLEGFAFLTGRLRQQMDKELPEVAHTLVQLLWPNYVRPVPSYCIIQYDSILDSMENRTVPKNTNLLSKKIERGISCRFRTCYEVEVMPLEVSKIDYLIYGKKSSLELELSVTSTGCLKDLKLDKLRFFLGGSKFIAKDLYLYLTRFIDSLEVNILNENSEIIKTIELDKNSIKQVGFDSDQKLAPYPLNSYDGYVLLQEYFCYSDKFMFLDFINLNKINKLDNNILEKSRKFSITMNLSKRLVHNELPTKDSFSLYCTPAINLFKTDAVPIRKDETKSEHLIVASDMTKDYSEIFSIEKVRGWIPSKNIYDDYALFESFNHNDDVQYYSTRIKLTASGDSTNTYLRFASNEGMYENAESSNATVSVEVLCTNRNTPNNTLLIGDICISDPLSSTSKLTFKNITIPSPSYTPPINGDFLWKIISNMSLNYLSLDNVKALRSIIDTYDFVGANDIKRKEKTTMKLHGIKSIQHETTEMMDRGFPLRGIQTNLVIDPKKYECLGDAYIFCTILNEFLSLYGNINSFHKLLVDIENEDIFTWNPKMGSKSLV